MTFRSLFSIFSKPTPEKSDFSVFFREKSKEEQKRVLIDVVRKANQDQKAIIDKYRNLQKLTH
ncbi:MAG: hypothetical protein Q8L47_04765 [bacterium]|nr:hypothetical protein [bacterium]